MVKRVVMSALIIGGVLNAQNICLFPSQSNPLDTYVCNKELEVYNEKECKKIQELSVPYEKNAQNWDNTLENLISYSMKESNESEAYNKVNIEHIFSSYLHRIMPSGELREATKCNGNTCSTKAYNDEGQVIFEANCLNGLHNGKQIVYRYEYDYEKDKYKQVIKAELNYNNGVLNGKQKFDEAIIEVKNGKLDGKVVANFGYGDCDGCEYGHYGLEGNFKDGHPIGLLTLSDASGFDGHISNNFTINFNNKGQANGKAIFISDYSGIEGDSPASCNVEIVEYKNGKVVKFKQGSTEGELCFQEDNKGFESILPKIEKLELKTKEDITYINTDSFHTISSYSSGQYNDAGENMGLWITKEEISNKPMYVEFDDDGNEIPPQDPIVEFTIKKEENYLNDKLHGKVKVWRNGAIIKEEIYENGNRTEIIR